MHSVNQCWRICATSPALFQAPRDGNSCESEEGPSHPLGHPSQCPLGTSSFSEQEPVVLRVHKVPPDCPAPSSLSCPLCATHLALPWIQILPQRLCPCVSTWTPLTPDTWKGDRRCRTQNGMGTISPTCHSTCWRDSIWAMWGYLGSSAAVSFSCFFSQLENLKPRLSLLWASASLQLRWCSAVDGLAVKMYYQQ